MKVVCGFNVNIDAIYNIKGDEASDLIKKYTQQDVKILPQSINSISDFVYGLVFCMQNGAQAELIIQNQEVYQFLKDTFLSKSLIRIGGNAGIMANVLSFKGVHVILHSPSPSKTQQSLMLEKDRIIINSDNSKINDRDDEINFIFDFKCGEKIIFNNKSIIVPRENRFIVSNTNTNYSINSDFKKCVDKYINELNGGIFSGFHVISKEKSVEFIEYIKSIKRKNKNILIHVELGHFVKSDNMSFIFQELSESVDSIGLNESELAMLFKKDVDEILNMDAKFIIDAAIVCKSFSNLKKIIIHTREFVISIFNTNSKYIEPILELKSLQYGIECVARFASIGKLDNYNNDGTECKLYKSVKGLNQVSSMMAHINGIQYEDGFFGMYKNQMVCMVPTYLCKNPISTVGLGDTIIANIFLKQLRYNQLIQNSDFAISSCSY